MKAPEISAIDASIENALSVLVHDPVMVEMFHMLQTEHRTLDKAPHALLKSSHALN